MKNLNIIKLWKQILKLAEIETDKAKLIVESDLAEGVEVFVEKEGEYVAAEDGEYIAEDKIIIVADGKVTEIREKEEEKPAEELPVEQEEEVVIEEPEKDEKDALIAELQDKVAELEKLLGEKDDKIAELESELAKKNQQLEMSCEKPAKEVVKEKKEGALKYFN